MCRRKYFVTIFRFIWNYVCASFFVADTKTAHIFGGFCYNCYKYSYDGDVVSFSRSETDSDGHILSSTAAIIWICRISHRLRRISSRFLFNDFGGVVWLFWHLKEIWINRSISSTICINFIHKNFAYLIIYSVVLLSNALTHARVINKFLKRRE